MPSLLRVFLAESAGETSAAPPDASLPAIYIRSVAFEIPPPSRHQPQHHRMFSRMFSAACSRLEVLTPSNPGGRDRSRRPPDDRSRSSAPTTTLTPEDDHAAEQLAMSEGGTPGAISMPVDLLPPSQLVVVALDANRKHSEVEVRIALRSLLARGDILRCGDSLVVLCVLHAVTNSMGYQTKMTTDSFAGRNTQYLRDQVAKKAEYYRTKLLQDVEALGTVGISVTLKVSPGSPAKGVIIHELNSSKAAWVVLDRHFKRDFKHLEKHIACKVAAFQDNLSLQTLKSMRTNLSSKGVGEVKNLEHLVVSLDLSSKKHGNSMQDLTPSMSITSITMVDETNALDIIGEAEDHNATGDKDDNNQALHLPLRGAMAT